MNELEEAFVCFSDVRVPLNQATITTRDLPSLIRSLNRNPTQAELQALCNEIDARGEGTINFQTFMQIMQRQFPPPEPMSEIINAFESDEEVDAILAAAEPYKRGDMIDYRSFARMLSS